MDGNIDSIERIRPILTNLLKADWIDSDEDLLQSGKLTSLTSLNLIVAIEDEFQLRIPNKELNRSNLTSLVTIAAMVDRLQIT